MRIRFILLAILAMVATGCAGDETTETLVGTSTSQRSDTTPPTTAPPAPTTTAGPATTTTTAAPTTTTAAPSTTTTTTTIAIRPITIMPIGDSITQGAAGWATYRCYLDRMLTEAAVPFDLAGGLTDPFGGQPYGCATEFDTDHEGRWGWRADEVIAPVVASAQALQPDVALIHLGTNDVLQGQDNAGTLGDLRDLIAGIQAVSPATTLLVAQIIPCDAPQCATAVPALNDGIAGLTDLSTNQSPVIVVDMATGFSLDGLRDGVHPTDAGDEFIAGRWMEAMRQQGLIGAP